MELSVFSDPVVHFGDRVVTIGALLSAAMVIVLAMVLLRITRSAVERRARLNVEQRARLYSAYLLLKYAVWVAAVITALQLLSINITFLVAGSAALLVGLGLGVQQTFNDIVSGIIILLEGTIRVGDVLEVEGLVGQVTEINLRTSTVYSRDGMNVIVPNHRFINENVVNWSHNALETRFRFSVGVAYGSDPDQVERILLRSASTHPMVIQNDDDHAVQARLADFGDSALVYEVLFWSKNIFHIERTKAEIRTDILRRFREEGVTIPFPQRDVHMIPPDQHG